MFRKVALRMLLPGSLIAAAAAGFSTVMAQSRPDMDQAVQRAYAQYRGLHDGKNADYIPALAKVNPDLFGIAVVTVDGNVATAGDIKSEVSIQSISKVFAMALVMEESGPDAIKENMGVDATGQVFNSIVAIEQYKGKEMNPLVNPGAITATSMVRGDTADQVWAKIIGIYSDFAGRPLSVNQEVYKSESDTNQRNQAIAMLMFAYERIKANPQQEPTCTHAVFGERKCEGHGCHGGDAGEWRQKPRDG